MIELYVSGQTLRMYTPVIAADSLRTLTVKVYCSDNWDGFAKWLHFRQGEGLDATVYDLALNEDDEITAEDELSLNEGEWELYLTGTLEQARLTSTVLRLTVKPSGLIDGPLHSMPLSVAEQIDAKASQALMLAQTVREAAERGDFKGADGTSFRVLGYYASLEALAAAVSAPGAGDAYGVGDAAPYHIYLYDGVGRRWVDNGEVQGVKGESGDRGVTFTPSVDANGILTWTNDGGLTNPAARDIRGPAGAQGSPGTAGAGAYEKAAEAGYTGTEATFYAALTVMPYHNARHLPDGADPITVRTGNLENGAVTAEKLAAGAVTASYTATVGTTWTGAGPYTQTVSVPGLLATDTVLLDLLPSDTYATALDEIADYALLYRAVAAADSLSVYATAPTGTALTIQVKAVRK